MKFQNVNLTKLYIRWGYLFMAHKQSPQSCECVFCLSRQMFLQGRIAEQSQYLQNRVSEESSCDRARNMYNLFHEITGIRK